MKLETLRLGHGVFPSTDKPDTSNFLAKLVDMSGVKTLHLFNGLVRGADDEDAYLKIDWNLFDACVLLRQLAVSRLGPDLRTWLNTVRRSVEELIVTDHYAFYASDLKQFDLLRLPNLTYVFTREITAEREPDIWSVTDSESGLEFEWDSELESGMESEDELETQPETQSASGTIASSDVVANTDAAENDLEPGGASDLECDLLSVQPLRGSQTITVLDRLHDGGASLKRLGICLDLNNSWVIDHTHITIYKLLANFSGSFRYSLAEPQATHSAPSQQQERPRRRIPLKRVIPVARRQETTRYRRALC